MKPHAPQPTVVRGGLEFAAVAARAFSRTCQRHPLLPSPASAGCWMSNQQRPDERAERAGRWAPDLGAARLIGSGRTAALLRWDATVQWWCAPDFDDAPVCWQLLDPDGGAASFCNLAFFDAGSAPAGASARTLLRGATWRCGMGYWMRVPGWPWCG